MKILCLVLLEIFCVSCLHAQFSTREIVPHSNTKRNVAAAAGPVLFVSDCYMLEETLIDVNNSQCVFEIHSSDGNLGTLTFTIETPDDSDIFDLQYKELPEISDMMAYIYLVLKDNQTLKYDTKKTFTFDVEVEGASYKVPITVNVYKLPSWSTFPSILEIVEGQNTSFIISAKAGEGHTDPAIVIHTVNTTYDVIESNIDNHTIEVFVPAIDREEQSSFLLDVIATYLQSPYGTIYGHIVALVIDIDDNPPRIRYDNYTQPLEVVIPEKTTHVIVTNIKITDADEGINSEFSIDVKTSDRLQSAIEFSPSSGFRNVTLEITIDTTKLDFNDTMWSTFTIEINAKGVKNQSAEDSLPVKVSLYKLVSSGCGTVGAVWAVIFSVLLQCWWYLR